MTDVGWRDVATSAPVGLALVAAALVLFAYRRAAPQGCRLAAGTFLGLLAFHAALVVTRPRLNIAVMQGDDALSFFTGTKCWRSCPESPTPGPSRC